MPHQCTKCGRTFADGSKEMLGGCPACGGNKFQFHPDDVSEADDLHSDDGPPAESPTPPAPADPDVSSVVGTVGRATTRVRDLVASDTRDQQASGGEESVTSEAAWPGDDIGPDESGSTPLSSSGTLPDSDIIDADARREQRRDSEGSAQADARTEVVGKEDVPTSVPDTSTESDESSASTDSSTDPDEYDGEVISKPSPEEPDLAELREQLNEQFESIKIIEPGQYELNLMELYDREEYIISLQENGRYVIQVPEQWMGDEPLES